MPGKSKMARADSQQLTCDECGIGYADCTCPPIWIDEEKRKEHDKEIRDIKGGIAKAIAARKRARTVYRRMSLYIPRLFLEALQIRARGERKTLSAYLRRLLMVHSSPPKRKVKPEGELVKTTITLPLKLIERMKLRAEAESTNLSAILVGHVAKEFAVDSQSN